MQALTRAIELDRMLEDSIRRMNNRLQYLDDQIRMADEILMEFDSADEYEHQYIDDSDDEFDDSSTVAYYTLDEYTYSSDDEDEESDTETVIVPWTDPYRTPERRMDVVIPDDVDDGLDILNEM